MIKPWMFKPIPTAGAGYRYFRWNFTAGKANQLVIVEAEVLVSSVDICSGGTASASRYYGAFTPAKAFDDNLTWDYRWDAYASPIIYPEWLKYDLGAGNSEEADQYTLFISNNSSVVCPTAWQFQGSNNNTDWDTLDTQTGQSFTDGVKKTYTIS